jgi:iron complex outermembrane receptor protein
MKSRSQAGTRGLCVTAAALCATAGANAQSPANTAGRAADGTDLDTVIVTAQRRAEDVQATPIAITVLDGQDLQARGASSTEEILRDLPGVEIRKSPAGASIYVRGIATQQGGGELDPGISFSIDGVYHPFMESSFSAFSDLERIEVLKGPQGTLYGRNAIAGAVNVITRSPKIGDSSGFAQVSVGDYDARGLTAAVNVPLGERLALRLSGDHQYRDGYMNLGSDDQDVIAARAKLLWETSDALRIEFRGDYAEYDMLGYAPARFPFRPDPYTQFPTPVEPSQAGWVNGLSLSADLDLGFGTLTYIPALKRKNNRNATDGGGTFIRSYVFDDQTTHELRLASAQSTPLSWIVGGYYYRGVNDTGLAFVTTIDQHVVTTSYAAFGQSTYSVTDRFRFTGGLRFTRDEKNEDGINTQAGVVISQINDIEWTWDNWTWRAGTEFDITPESMFYGSVSTGFKAGGTSLVAGPAAVFDPEKLTAYEVGWKNRLFDRSMILNVSAYYYDYTNYQASFVAPNPAFGGASVRRIANAGDAKIQGAEVEMSWAPTPLDTIRATAAYIDGEFGTYRVPTPNPLIFSDYSGSKLAAIPWAFTASYSHDFVMGNDARLTPLLSARYNVDARRDTRQYATAGSWGPAGTYANTVSLQESFVKLDFFVNYAWKNDKYRLSAFVKNLTDEVVFTGRTLNAVTGVGNASLEPPRTIGASFNVNW